MKKMMVSGHSGEGFNGLHNGDLVEIQKEYGNSDFVEFWEAGSVIDCGFDTRTIKGNSGEAKLKAILDDYDNCAQLCIAEATGFYNYRYEGDIKLYWYCPESEYTEWTATGERTGEELCQTIETEEN